VVESLGNADLDRFNSRVEIPITRADMKAVEEEYGIPYSDFLSTDLAVQQNALKRFHLQAIQKHQDAFRPLSEVERKYIKNSPDIMLELKKSGMKKLEDVRVLTPSEITGAKDFELKLGDDYVYECSTKKMSKNQHYVEQFQTWKKYLTSEEKARGEEYRGGFIFSDVRRMIEKLPHDSYFVPYPHDLSIRDIAKTVIDGNVYPIGLLKDDQFLRADDFLFNNWSTRYQSCEGS